MPFVVVSSDRKTSGPQGSFISTAKNVLKLDELPAYPSITSSAADDNKAVSKTKNAAPSTPQLMPNSSPLALAYAAAAARSGTTEACFKYVEMQKLHYFAAQLREQDAISRQYQALALHTVPSTGKRLMSPVPKPPTGGASSPRPDERVAAYRARPTVISPLPSKHSRMRVELHQSGFGSVPRAQSMIVLSVTARPPVHMRTTVTPSSQQYYRGAEYTTNVTLDQSSSLNQTAPSFFSVGTDAVAEEDLTQDTPSSGVESVRLRAMRQQALSQRTSRLWTRERQGRDAIYYSFVTTLTDGIFVDFALALRRIEVAEEANAWTRLMGNCVAEELSIQNRSRLSQRAAAESNVRRVVNEQEAALRTQTEHRVAHSKAVLDESARAVERLVLHTKHLAAASIRAERDARVREVLQHRRMYPVSFFPEYAEEEHDQ